MARVRIPLSSFSFGEVSSGVTARVDTQIYNAAAERVRNFIILSEGGVKKRPGTKRLYNFASEITYDASKRMQCRIEPFIFSDDEQYLFAFSHDQLDIFRVAIPSFTVTHIQKINTDVNGITLPFDVDYLESMTVTTKGDIMFIAQQNFMIRKIVRTGLTTFQVETFSFDESASGALTHMPFFAFQTSGTTITPSATQSTATTLNGAINASVTSVTLASASGIPTSGEVLIGSELISYTNISTNTLTGCTRGVAGTSAASHSNGVQVTFTPRLTVSAAYFDDSYRTNSVRLRIADTEVSVVGFISSTVVVCLVFGVIQKRLTVEALRTIEGGKTIEVTHIGHGLSQGNSIVITDAASIATIAASDINGTKTIVSIINENTYTITAGGSNNASISTDGGGQPKVASTAATTEWQEQSYSALRYYPGAITFHENRLWLAGTVSQPDGIWASKSGQYFNFDIGTALDNESLDITTNLGDIFTIRHLVSNRDLQIFSSTAELFIPTLTQKPITPTNAIVRRQTPFGAGFARPVPFDGATLFVDRSGTNIREFLFTEGEAAYTSSSISAIASHLVVTPTQSLATKGAFARPETFAFFVNSDGTLAVFYSLRGDKKQGWSMWDTQGKFHSLCSIENRLYTIAVRDDGSGANKFYLEEFDEDMPMDFCDTFSGSNSVFGSLTSHFSNGAVVKVRDTSDFLGSYTIGSGSIDVSNVKPSVTSAFIGYQYTPLLKTLPVDSYATRNGATMTGMPRKITSVVLDMVDTLAVSVNGNDLIIRNVTDDMSTARTPITGHEEFRILGYSRNPRIEISQSTPFDLQLNGMVVEVNR